MAGSSATPPAWSRADNFTAGRPAVNLLRPFSVRRILRGTHPPRPLNFKGNAMKGYLKTALVAIVAIAVVNRVAALKSIVG
jgi:hypothetical protein